MAAELIRFRSPTFTLVGIHIKCGNWGFPSPPSGQRDGDHVQLLDARLPDPLPPGMAGHRTAQGVAIQFYTITPVAVHYQTKPKLSVYIFRQIVHPTFCYFGKFPIIILT